MCTSGWVGIPSRGEKTENSILRLSTSLPAKKEEHIRENSKVALALSIKSVCVFRSKGTLPGCLLISLNGLLLILLFLSRIRPLFLYVNISGIKYLHWLTLCHANDGWITVTVKRHKQGRVVAGMALLMTRELI